MRLKSSPNLPIRATRHRAVHVRLGLALYHWPRVVIQHEADSRTWHAQLRGRGHSQPCALRSVADRLLNVTCTKLRHGTRFNPEVTRALPTTS